MRRRIFEIAESGAGLRVTRDDKRFELLVTVGSATFAARLTLDQAHALARALLGGTHDEKGRRLRALPIRQKTDVKFREEE